MHTILTTALALLFIKTIVSLALDWINLRHVRKNAGTIPESFRDFMDDATYAKSVSYTEARTRFGMLSEIFDAVLLAVVLIIGLLPWLYEGFAGMLGDGVWGQGLVLIAILFVLGLPGLPFDWWSTFRLEARFGFNKSTLKLWITDKIKGSCIGLAIGLPLLALLLWLVDALGANWWLWGYAVFFVFQLFMVVAYPMYIMPLFNKLEPLEEGELKTRLFALADRTGFKAQTILVMDGSKRSGHSNAFFAGFGRFRRIVLFDTLIEQMNTTEIEAVLAHEIGHYKLGHIPKMIVLSAVSTFIMFATLGWLTHADWFLSAFYFDPVTVQRLVPVFLLVSLLGGLIGFWFGPLSSRLSRKHEYEADAFARRAMEGPDALVAALRKLHKENLSNLTPHPLYSAFHYSHPTLPEREGALRHVED
ncbi:MAG: M48 family metalloprotease [Verrucomicrobia bacterium]|nr:M48 family metalloprotease [Verrucomicrobiota bacterium]